MITALRHLIAAPETRRQLAELATGAPPSALLSLRLPLPGAATARMGALLAAVTEAAQAARTAQRRAAACGLGGSAFEQALEAQACAAEALEKRVRPEVFY